MRKIVITLSVLALIASSCGKQAAKEQTEVVNNEVANNEVITEQKSEEEQSVSVIPSIQVDWKKVHALKNSTIEELKKKEKSEDRIIMNFLNKYSKLPDEFERIFFSQDTNYQLSRAYLSAALSGNTRTLDFVNEFETNGFRFKQAEGDIYIDRNGDFIKSGILPLVNSISAEFINLYSNEIDNECCDDAAINISEEELVNRVYKWGELSKKVTELEYKKHVEDAFYSNLNLLFIGVDNTPAFDWETKKFNNDLIDLMNRIIEENPTSRAAIEFKQYIEILRSENFENTQKVIDYRLRLKSS